MSACGGDSSSPTQPDPPDRGGPSLTCPAALTAASPDGDAVVLRFANPTPEGGVSPVRVTCVPESGSAFKVGATTVQCTALASDGQTGTCSFAVTVSGPQHTLRATRFLAFGDSMTLGEVTSPVAESTASGMAAAGPLIIVPEAAYPRQLQFDLAARYSPQAIQVVNAGKSGEMATAGVTRFAQALRDESPQVVLLLEGANDLAAFGDAGISKAAGAIEAMAKEARMRNVRAFIGTLPPPKPGGRNHVPAETVQALNARLRSVALGEGAVIVDVYAALVGDIDTNIGSDGLHPTEIGYEHVAAAFFDAIRAALEDRAP